MNACTCPYCGQPGIPWRRKPFLRSALPVPCTVCGRPVAVHRLAWVLNVPPVLFALFTYAFPTTPARALLFYPVLAGLFVLSGVIQVVLVPLVPAPVIGSRAGTRRLAWGIITFLVLLIASLLLLQAGWLARVQTLLIPHGAPEQPVYTTASGNAPAQFAPDGQHLVVLDKAGSITRIAGDGSGAAPTQLTQTKAERYAVAPDGASVATLSGGVLQLWPVQDPPAAGPRWTYQEPNGGTDAVAFSPDGQWLAVEGTENALVLVRTSDGQAVRHLPGHTGAIRGLAFTPDSQTLLSVSDDQTVRQWRVADGSLVRVLEGHTWRVEALALSPDGQIAATASTGRDATVRLWRVADGQPLGVWPVATPWSLEFSGNVVQSLAWSPDGRTLAVAACSRVYLRQLPDGHTTGILEAPEQRIARGVVWAADGQRLLVTWESGAVQIWQRP